MELLWWHANKMVVPLQVCYSEGYCGESLSPSSAKTKEILSKLTGMKYETARNTREIDSPWVNTWISQLSTFSKGQK